MVDHASVIVVKNNYVASEYYYDTVVDAHSHDRYHVAWTLSPYNAYEQTTTYFIQYVDGSTV